MPQPATSAGRQGPARRAAPRGEFVAKGRLWRPRRRDALRRRGGRPAGCEAQPQQGDARHEGEQMAGGARHWATPDAELPEAQRHAEGHERGSIAARPAAPTAAIWQRRPTAAQGRRDRPWRGRGRRRGAVREKRRRATQRHRAAAAAPRSEPRKLTTDRSAIRTGATRPAAPRRRGGRDPPAFRARAFEGSARGMSIARRRRLAPTRASTGRRPSSDSPAGRWDPDTTPARPCWSAPPFEKAPPQQPPAGPVVGRRLISGHCRARRSPATATQGAWLAAREFLVGWAPADMRRSHRPARRVDSAARAAPARVSQMSSRRSRPQMRKMRTRPR